MVNNGELFPGQTTLESIKTSQTLVPWRQHPLIHFPSCQPLDSWESHSLRRVLAGPADAQNCIWISLCSTCRDGKCQVTNHQCNIIISIISTGFWMGPMFYWRTVLQDERCHHCSCTWSAKVWRQTLEVITNWPTDHVEYSILKWCKNDPQIEGTIIF